VYVIVGLFTSYGLWQPPVSPAGSWPGYHPEAASLVVWAEVSKDSCTIALALLRLTVSLELGAGAGCGFAASGFGRTAVDGAAACVWAALVTGLIILKILLHALSAAGAADIRLRNLQTVGLAEVTVGSGLVNKISKTNNAAPTTMALSARLKTGH